jgi:hypothetical protein
MKSLKLLSFATVALMAATTHAEPSTPMKEPLRVNNIFIPTEGFDDNDNVEFVLDGDLKNACFQLGMSSVKIEGNVISVSLESHRADDTYCTQDDAVLPEAIQAPVPFYKEIELGQLKAGQYTLRYETASLVVNRTFNVAHAPTNSQDSLNYAPVQNASIDSIVKIGDNVKLRLTGVLTSSCMHLRDEALVSQDGDVVVVQPLVTVDLTSKCLMYLRPFSQDVTVPNLAEGRYLIHIRSMNGRALNRVLSVSNEASAAL